MEFDIFNNELLFKSIVFFIYGIITVVAIIFTFSLDAYRKIDEKLNLNIILTPIIINPLERNIKSFDAWLMEHNRTVGPLLVILSIVDLKLWLDIINLL